MQAELSEDVLAKFASTCSGEINPMCAMVGGIVGQEVVKAISSKFGPITQWLYFDRCAPAGLRRCAVRQSVRSYLVCSTGACSCYACEVHPCHPGQVRQRAFGFRPVLVDSLQCELHTCEQPQSHPYARIMGCNHQARLHTILTAHPLCSIESLPAEVLPEAEYAATGSRYDGQVAVFGRALQAQLEKLSVFLVGAGALGCELLKNLALMGVATGDGGLVTVTDDDTIEKSNLSRQFPLPRLEHWRVQGGGGGRGGAEDQPRVQGPLPAEPRQLRDRGRLQRRVLAGAFYLTPLCAALRWRCCFCVRGLAAGCSSACARFVFLSVRRSLIYSGALSVPAGWFMGAGWSTGGASVAVVAALHLALPQSKVYAASPNSAQYLQGLDVVVNALDNVNARLYVDSRCVYCKKPLLESGTLGTKCNTQMVIPDLTENYGASRDPPEKTAPMCTLHSFPHNIDHCLTWARSEFEGALEGRPTGARLHEVLR